MVVVRRGAHGRCGWGPPSLSILAHNLGIKFSCSFTLLTTTITTNALLSGYIMLYFPRYTIQKFMYTVLGFGVLRVKIY